MVLKKIVYEESIKPGVLDCQDWKGIGQITLELSLIQVKRKVLSLFVASARVIAVVRCFPTPSTQAASHDGLPGLIMLITLNDW